MSKVPETRAVGWGHAREQWLVLITILILGLMLAVGCSSDSTVPETEEVEAKEESSRSERRDRTAEPSAAARSAQTVVSADISVKEIRVEPSEVEAGETVLVTVIVANEGGQTAVQKLDLFIDGDVDSTESISVPGEDEKTVEFRVKREEARTYTVRIANQSGTFKVRPPAAAKSPNELVRVGDFSVALVDVDREEQKTWLKFAITKLGDLNEPLSPLDVTLIDDHGNEHGKAWLAFSLGLGGVGERGDALASLPQGFTYTTKVGVSIPRLAPIEVLKLGDEDMSFSEINTVPPQLLEHNNEHYAGEGQAVKVGKWLTFSRSQILPAPWGGWVLEVDVENGEYSPRSAEVHLGVQFQDADIVWADVGRFDVPGVSKDNPQFLLPDEEELQEKPHAFVLVFTDRETEETRISLSPLFFDDLPPAIGQGLGKQGVEKFAAAYENGGGFDLLGYPLGVPYWLGGGEEPAGPRDVVVQEFPGTIGVEGPVILWAMQHGSLYEAVLINGSAWNAYRTAGGPGGLLGYPNGNLDTSTEGHLIVDFENGYLGTYDGVSYSPFKYPSGWLAYDCHENSTHVCVSEFQGLSLQGPQLDLYSADWALSPYGGVLAYEPTDTSSWWANRLHIDVISVDADHRQTVFEERWDQHDRGTPWGLNCISWSPDNSKITFRKSLGDQYSLTDDVYHTVGSDGTGLSQLNEPEPWADCSWGAAKSPDGQWTADAKRSRSGFSTTYAVRLSGPGNRHVEIEAPFLNFWHDEQIEWSGDLLTTSSNEPTQGNPGKLLWRFSVDRPYSPAVVDGVVYFGSYNDHVYAVDATHGTTLWYFQTGGDSFATPTVSDGVVYAGSGDNYFYAMDSSTGDLVWRYHQGDGQESSPVVVNGVAYVIPDYGYLYALDVSTRELLWRYETETDGAFRGHVVPQVTDGLVYVGSGSGLHALNAMTGKLLWHFETTASVFSPKVAGGVVYLPFNGSIYAMDAKNGQILWEYYIGAYVQGIVVADGVVYGGSYRGQLYALEASTGALLWVYQTDTNVEFHSGPAIADGVVYAAAHDEHLYALEASTGQLLWRYETETSAFGEPVVADGVVYLATSDYLYALSASTNN